MKVTELPKKPLNAYDAANIMFELNPESPDYNSPALAQIALSQMLKANFKFLGYDDDGEETYLRQED